MVHIIGSIMTAVIVFGLYFLPAVLATLNRHKSVVLIWLLNGFLGWSIIGWIAALIWTLNPPNNVAQPFDSGTVSTATGTAKNLQGVGIAFGVFAALGLLSGLAPKTTTTTPATTTSASSQTSIQALAASTNASAASSSTSSAFAGNWTYSDTTDKMRGTTTKLAEITSDNQLAFGFPYKGGYTSLTVRRTGAKLDAFIQIDGQFTCTDYTGDSVAVKFDDSPVVNYPCAEADDGTTGILFINNTSKFVARLKTSHHVTIEAPFYQEGRQQIEFTSSGLQF